MRYKFIKILLILIVTSLIVGFYRYITYNENTFGWYMLDTSKGIFTLTIIFILTRLCILSLIANKK